MRVILAAGGSGGHIFPSVAVAGELEKSGVKDIFFVSSKRRLDRNILSGERYKCFFLSVNPMPLRFNPVKMVVFLAKLVADAFASVYIIARTRPNAVVGFGGYSSGAIVLCAKVFGIPVMIHEQNLLPGRANRILSRFADKVAVSFEDSREYFTEAAQKMVYSGNPLRINTLSYDRVASARDLGLSPDKFTVLIMGGSQGSTFLNKTASEAARRVRDEKKGEVQFIHLTGKKDYEDIKKFYEENGIEGKVYSFLERIDEAYSLSDLAVSRAGAAAVFELAYYAKPMILIPYPSEKNNQRQNAVYFFKRGAAIYREEKGLSADGLAREVLDVMTDEALRESISISAVRLSRPQAARKLADEVITLAQKRNK